MEDADLQDFGDILRPQQEASLLAPEAGIMCLGFKVYPCGLSDNLKA